MCAALMSKWRMCSLRLRGLEIQGFKSFPDKTRLTFHDGITAVVGPNGSGKSNIADAVRWVLGEQSTKTLRGGKMEDVIFGGTQARKPQGYAHVQLTIENADGALPYDSAEVSVSRRLYRSGESEYRINGTSVRLRDVHELFMDTGLGRDGYSIIGQGRIAEIVSAKSTQRREIFEEAAGISKYRYRRQEAQRRLEAAEENLLRLRDILAELEARVGPLQAQAEKARRFLTLAEEKKTLELSLWIATLDRSRALLREQEDKLLLCRDDHDRIQAEMDAVEQRINALYADMQALAVEIDERRAQARTLEEENANSSADIAVMQNDLAHNRASIEQIGAELRQADADGGGLDEQIRTYETEIADKQAALEKLHRKQEETQQEIVRLTAAREDCRTRADALKERRFGLTQSIQEAKLSSASSGSLIDETIARLEALRDAAVVGDENAARIEKELADCKGLLAEVLAASESLQNTRRGYLLRAEGRGEKLDALKKQRAALDEQARGFLQKARLLTDMENSLEGFQSSVKYVVSQARRGALPGVCGPVSKLIEVDGDHALAIEIALGAAMQNIVVEDETAAKRAIAMLRSSKTGRATFLPLTTVRGGRLSEGWLSSADGFVGIAADLVRCDSRYEGVVAQLLGRIAIVRDIDCAVALARRGGYKFRVVTLDGQVVNAGGSMTGGWTARSAGILSRAQEIDSLRAQAKDCADRMERLDGEIKTVQEELSAAQAAILGVDGELATAQEDRIRCESEQKRLLAAQAEAARVREQAAREYEALEARLRELRAAGVSADGLIQELSGQLDEVARQLGEVNEGRDAYASRLDQASEALAQVNVAAAALEKEIDGARLMMEQLAGQKEHRREQERALKERAARLEEENEAVRQRISDLEAARRERTARIETIGTEIAERTARRNECESGTAALRADEKEIAARRETAARELARLEEKKASMQGEYDAIIARMWDEYEVTRSQAAELAQPVEDTPAAQRRLGELKGKIKALGSVNLGAIEEYGEVSERYTFLKTQTEDAERSRAELLRLIERLTSDMRTIFSENFTKIAANFSVVFTELFDGGKASLSLADPTDVLESGIDIFVQPPGKIIKNLSALSGGEQAFVAIAIYFAILKVRPSPFCLLDEIEAALDDVNVVKYAQYLRTLCDKTQFITITHRRGTMEEADVLYGVTMQEEGVSKLLELNVGEIEGKLGIQ